MSKLPYPAIDKDRCTGCHLCVEICPTNALAQINGKAELVRPDLCTYCSECEIKCPENAIALPYSVTFAVRKPGESPGDHSPRKD